MLWLGSSDLDLVRALNLDLRQSLVGSYQPCHGYRLPLVVRLRSGCAVSAVAAPDDHYEPACIWIILSPVQKDGTALLLAPHFARAMGPYTAVCSPITTIRPGPGVFRRKVGGDGEGTGVGCAGGDSSSARKALPLLVPSLVTTATLALRVSCGTWAALLVSIHFWQLGGISPLDFTTPALVAVRSASPYGRPGTRSHGVAIQGWHHGWSLCHSRHSFYHQYLRSKRSSQKPGCQGSGPKGSYGWLPRLVFDIS